MGFLYSSTETTEKEGGSSSSPLSTTHNRPFLLYRAGAGILKSSKDRKCLPQGGGKRGKIKGFSKSSRRLLMVTIAGVRKDADLPNFVTITYPDRFPDVKEAKRDLDVFERRLKRRFPAAGVVWKLEPQERGAPHYHLLVWGVDGTDLFSWVVNNWFEIAGQGDPNHKLFHSGSLPGSRPCVEKVRSWNGVMSYASKYLGKTFEVAEWGQKWTGRFWGIWNRGNIPFGEEREIRLSYREVCLVMRYQRRHAHIRGADRNSLTIFCDADQWIEKVLRL